MELDLQTKQQLAGLLAKPETVTQAHAGMLANLAKTYPYYQPLHLLLAKANANEANYQNTLTTAALYNQGSILHQVIFEPKTLSPIEDFNLVIYPENLKIEITEDQHITSNPEEVFEEINELQTEEINTEEPAIIDEQETFEEIAETSISVAEPVFVETYNFQEEHSEKVEEEVFDEINELDPSMISTAQEKEIVADPFPENEEMLTDLPIESIASSDFFAFEKSFSAIPVIAEELPVEELKSSIQETKPVLEPEEYNQEAEAQSTVSKYDDDKLPFTFLWWLAKTRKDHEQIFQPYVTPKKHKNPTALQQQYVEHIFHLQTPFNVAEETAKGPLNKQVVKKGDEIIDSFIKNDPQIRALKPDQLNNENKAKKSAEDHNDLVSETLATIYIEQMLYHKAIETYEKLSLKFPEKSRYFADLIQSLEKKI